MSDQKPEWRPAREGLGVNLAAPDRERAERLRRTGREPELSFMRTLVDELERQCDLEEYCKDVVRETTMTDWQCTQGVATVSAFVQLNKRGHS